MSRQLNESSSGHSNGKSGDHELLYLLGGVALIVFGTGLVLSNPSVRRMMGQFGIGNLIQSVVPDVERYFRLRNM